MSKPALEQIGVICSESVTLGYGSKNVSHRFNRCPVGLAGTLAAPGFIQGASSDRKPAGGGEQHSIYVARRHTLANDAPRPASLGHGLVVLPKMADRWHLGAGGGGAAPHGPESVGRDGTPGGAIIDSQSVRTTEKGGPGAMTRARGCRDASATS